MSIEKDGTIKKQSFGRIVYWAVFILLVVAVVSMLTVSVVNASYITSESSGSSANVAKAGVELELKQYGNKVDGIDYTKVVPGADIPGPHISLTIDSEVSYELYVQITELGVPHTATTIDYQLSSKWALVGDAQKVEKNGKEYTVYTYRYIVDANAEGENKFVFWAGTEHDYTGNNEIQVLANDAIIVSQYFDSENSDFEILFDAYVKQHITEG